MARILMFSMVLFLSGCETLMGTQAAAPSIQPEPKSWIHNSQVITEIISEPPGARIEINSQYVGDTPLKIHIFRAFNGLMNWWDGFTITATPIYVGQRVQRKYVSSDEPTPTRVFFDMRLQ